MNQADEVLAGVGRALAIAGAGDRSAAQRELEQLWVEVGVDGDALHRCSIAHTLADLQENPLDELRWDLCALDAGTAVDAERMRETGMSGSPAGLLPSLHLNVADVPWRLGKHREALTQVELGSARLVVLPHDGYREMIEGGLDRVRAAATKALNVSAVHGAQDEHTHAARTTRRPPSHRSADGGESQLPASATAGVPGRRTALPDQQHVAPARPTRQES